MYTTTAAIGPMSGAVYVLANPTGRYVTHAPDCRWLQGWFASPNGDSPYVLRPAASIPANVPGCAHCGGGR